MSTVSRQQYVSLYGPTAGDRFRLSDTALIAEVERSLIRPGEEAIYGGANRYEMEWVRSRVFGMPTGLLTW